MPQSRDLSSKDQLLTARVQTTQRRLSSHDSATVLCKERQLDSVLRRQAQLQYPQMYGMKKIPTANIGSSIKLLYVSGRMRFYVTVCDVELYKTIVLPRTCDEVFRVTHHMTLSSLSYRVSSWQAELRSRPDGGIVRQLGLLAEQESFHQKIIVFWTNALWHYSGIVWSHKRLIVQTCLWTCFLWETRGRSQWDSDATGYRHCAISLNVYFPWRLPSDVYEGINVDYSKLI